MKRICLFIIFICLFFTGVASAQSPREIFRKANLDYENGDYKKAVLLYKRLIEMKRVSPEVYYNLGNAYFKLKKIGKAIVNYERALKLAPRDRETRLNLRLARALAIDKIKSPERGFLLNVVLFFYDRMNIDELTIAVAFFYIVIMILLIFSIFALDKRRIMFYTVAVIFGFLIIFSTFLVFKIHDENFLKHAVIIARKVEVRSGPQKDYLLQFTLHEGTEVLVIGKRRDWYEISLSKDLRGWLPKDTVEVI